MEPEEKTLEVYHDTEAWEVVAMVNSLLYGTGYKFVDISKEGEDYMEYSLETPHEAQSRCCE